MVVEKVFYVFSTNSCLLMRSADASDALNLISSKSYLENKIIK
jgi:hypothetical protein